MAVFGACLAFPGRSGGPRTRPEAAPSGGKAPPNVGVINALFVSRRHASCYIWPHGVAGVSPDHGARSCLDMMWRLGDPAPPRRAGGGRRSLMFVYLIFVQGPASSAPARPPCGFEMTGSLSDRRSGCWRTWKVLAHHRDLRASTGSSSGRCRGSPPPWPRRCWCPSLFSWTRFPAWCHRHHGGHGDLRRRHPGRPGAHPGTPSSAAYTDDSYELDEAGQGGAGPGRGRRLLGHRRADGRGRPDDRRPAPGGGGDELHVVRVLLAGRARPSAPPSWSRAALPPRPAWPLLLGLFLSTVGLDITLGYPRFTFGTTELLNGVDFIPAMIGLFGVSEVMRNMEATLQTTRSRRSRPSRSSAGWPRRLLQATRLNMVRAGGIGTFIGILPGAGADIAAWIAYAVSKRFSKSRSSTARERSSRSWTPGRPTTPAWPATGCRRWSSASPATPSRRSSSGSSS